MKGNKIKMLIFTTIFWILSACSQAPQTSQKQLKAITSTLKSKTMPSIKLYRTIVIDSTQYLNRFEQAKFKQLPYQIQKPLDLDQQQSYPLLVFLHGVLHRGKDNEIQTEDILPIWANRTMQKQYPCFVLAPQCPIDSYWARFKRENNLIVLEKEPSKPVKQLFELIDSLCQALPIDKQRIYITGLSMGGFGTFDMILRKPDLFAAAVPVCGGGADSHAEDIKHLPIWIFHGSQDDVVPVQYSRDMVNALTKVGAAPKYTEYPDIKHDSWVEAYQDAAMWQWLFAQKRP